jgi:hypothetical protein
MVRIDISGKIRESLSSSQTISSVSGGSPLQLSMTAYSSNISISLGMLILMIESLFTLVASY